MKIPFKHIPSAHCENGATSNLLRHYNIELSEPIIFGMGSGYFFSYMPFIKLNGIPVVSFRQLPGMIFKRSTKRLGITVERQKFSSPEKAMNALDKKLEAGTPVGMLVGVFNLSYFPPEYRFHFNAHNLVVFGKENDTYSISDSVMENVEHLTSEELKKVRYAKGTLPPKGRMYYLTHVPAKPTIEYAIKKGIKHTCYEMLDIPFPLFGVKGIRYFAKRVAKWPKNKGEKRAALYLGQAIRMLEEIGTGGAGFRFMYAAFLQEAGHKLKEPRLFELSKEMTEIGDKWREFSYLGAKNLRTRGNINTPYTTLSEILLEIADREESLFKQLRLIVK